MLYCGAEIIRLVMVKGDAELSVVALVDIPLPDKSVKVVIEGFRDDPMILP